MAAPAKYLAFLNIARNIRVNAYLGISSSVVPFLIFDAFMQYRKVKDNILENKNNLILTGRYLHLEQIFE
jgi:hypothetical protein